jgi:N-acetylmuramic acid 6-phosphate (MurNAc-6-P) etherase
VKVKMAASILEQLQLLQSLVETDQKTVDAISARLAVIQSLLKNVAEQIERQGQGCTFAEPEKSKGS